MENASSCPDVPDEDDVHRWVTSTLDEGRCQAAELCIRIVDEQESAELNLRYREQSNATNVLSFPAELPEELQSQLEFPLLGDLVICAPVVIREAAQQSKQAMAHWAHMIVHGSLHLLGYDHIDDIEAAEMEQLESTILARCGFPDPYSPAPYPATNPQGAENL